MKTHVKTAICAALGALALGAGAQTTNVVPGDLLVTSSTYVDPGFGAGAALPNSAGVTAVASSAFCANANCSANVWNNASVDANFGTSSGIVLQSLNRATGAVDGLVDVTAQAASQGLNLVTSFASKSELGINLTPNGSGITFMGYQSSNGLLDISNSNAPGVVEAGNTDTAAATARTVAQLNLGTLGVQQTVTGAYSGNNGRAAVLGSNGIYYTVGNAGNGNGGSAITAGTGVQYVTPGVTSTQNNVGQYSIVQNGYAADKTAKDNNFRGMTVFNGTLYVTKGSGGNGINTVYQVGTAGSLPAAGNATPITVLPGFNTQLAKTDAMTPHPFGIFFANASTLYVADEGSGAMTDFGTSPTTQAGGLQKYSLVGGSWVLDYTLKGSLIGSSYAVNGTGALAGDSLNVTTDGLRNLTGKVNGDGTVTLYAATSTAGSALGDAGADPNKVVAITDQLSFTTATQAGAEDFTTLETAQLGQVLRGVALAPAAAVPEPASAAILLAGLGVVGAVVRRRKAASPASQA
jgi:hypothetical protein